MIAYATGVTGAREDLCRYLAACYYEPTEDFAEARLFDSIRSAAQAIDPLLAEAAERLKVEFSSSDLQTLLVDYTRLFIGPSQPLAMPYASFWLTDDMSRRHEVTVSVLDLYEQGGFEVSDEFRELPDHIAVELEFLYQLMFSENRANAEGNDDGLIEIQRMRRRFVRNHMCAWTGGFTHAIGVTAETRFYQALADLTQLFIRLESEIEASI